MQLRRIDPASATNRPPLRVLAVGEVAHHEFASATTLLQSSDSVSFRHTTHEGTHNEFDLLLVFQSHPQTIDQQQVAAWREQNLLAGAVVLLGSWCEGEQRTGMPLPKCERVFWYQFPSWWKRTLNAWRRGEPTSWHTFGNEPQNSGQQLHGLVAIDTADFDSANTIMSAIESVGFSGIWTPAHRPRPVVSGIDAAVWVGGQLDQREFSQLAEFRRWLSPQVPLTVLLDFPRREHFITLNKWGITNVLGKPWRVEDLETCLSTTEEPGAVKTSRNAQTQSS